MLDKTRQRLIGLPLWVVLLTLLACPALAQDDQKPQIEFDLDTMLTSNDVLPSSVAGPIWRISPSPGRILLQIPLIVKPGDQEYDLSTSSLKMRGSGRLIAYRLEFGEELDAPPGSDLEARQKAAQSDPDAIPRMSRRVTITPGGTMKWDMERVIPPSGEVVGGDSRNYAKKIDFQLLNASRPTPPDTRNPTPQTRAAVAEYRQKNAEWRDMREHVMDLPDDFEERIPARIWAVFEMPSFERDLEFNGPEPLPWAITLENFQAIRKLNDGIKTVEGTTFGNFGAKLDDQSMQLVQRALEMYTTQDRHVYTTRLITYALTNAGAVAYAQPGDPLFMLLQQLLTNNDDTHSRKILFKDLVSTIPPTPATRQLMTMAGKDLMDAAMQFERLRGLVRELGNIGQGGAMQMQETIATANRVLQDPEGPPPGEILGSLVAAAKKNEQVRNALLNGIQFEALPDDRRDHAIKFVLEEAPSSELAATWLNARLLGSMDQRLLTRTLQILNSADTGSPVMKQAADTFLSMIFAQPAEGAADITEALPTPKMTGPIPIPSPRHNFFRAIQHGQSDIREAAWRSLNYFYFPPLGQSAEQATGMLSNADRYSLLVDAAINQSPTPVAAVDFIAKQPDAYRASQALVRFVMVGSPRASARASRLLLGSERNLSPILMNLSFGERHGFGMKMYANLSRDDNVNLVLPLLRQRVDDSPIALWFSQKVREGKLPEADQWHTAYQESEDKMLELIASSDVELAKAAVAALVFSIGGDARNADMEAGRLMALPDKSLPSLREAWASSRENIYLNLLQRKAGPYRMKLLVGDSMILEPLASGETELRPDLVGVNNITVGVIQLQASHEGVSLSSESLATEMLENDLGFRITTPAAIKGLSNNRQLNDVPLDQVTRPIDMKLMDDGTFRGLFTLPIGTALLVLEPTE